MTFDCVGGVCAGEPSVEHWTIRDLDGRVLREIDHPWSEGWEWKRDYVYRGSQLLAAVESDGSGGERVRHLHLDHLGTPRQITGPSDGVVAFHAYYPFGEEATDLSQDKLKLKFTGHERDGTSAGLDYMHARYCSAVIGRFSSIDPKVLRFGSRDPRRWNRYSYALGNPLRFTDENGEAPAVPLVLTTTSAPAAAIISPAIAAGGLVAITLGSSVYVGRKLGNLEFGGQTMDFIVSDKISDLIVEMGNSSRGGRGRIQTAQDAQEQYEDILDAQEKVRSGKLDKQIDSTEKSRQRADHSLDKIGSSAESVGYNPFLDLSKADLSGADLSGADLSGADLSEANLSRAKLDGAKLRGTGLSGVDLSKAKDLSSEQIRSAL